MGAPAAKPPLQAAGRPTLTSQNSFTSVDALLKQSEDPFASAFGEDDKQQDMMMVDLADSEPVEDIDANDRDDLTCCVEYVNEIFEYCHMKEVCLLPALYPLLSSITPLFSYHFHSSVHPRLHHLSLPLFPGRLSPFAYDLSLCTPTLLTYSITGTR